MWKRISLKNEETFLAHNLFPLKFLLACASVLLQSLHSLLMSCACPRSASEMCGLWMEKLSKDFYTDRLPLLGSEWSCVQIKKCKNGATQAEWPSKLSSGPCKGKIPVSECLTNAWWKNRRSVCVLAQILKLTYIVSLQVSNEQTRFQNFLVSLCFVYIMVFVYGTALFPYKEQLNIWLMLVNLLFFLYEMFSRWLLLFMSLLLCTIHHAA